MDWSGGDLVWYFDQNIGHPLPGEIQEVHHAAQVIIVQTLINGKVSKLSSRGSGFSECINLRFRFEWKEKKKYQMYDFLKKKKKKNKNYVCFEQKIKR